MSFTVTTQRNRPKPFSWSYSKLKNYETCPKRHWHLDVAKDVKEEESEHIQYGNALHKALAERIEKNAPLPKPFEKFDEWCTKVVGAGNAKILVEQKLAINKDFGPCSWFGDEDL